MVERWEQATIGQRDSEEWRVTGREKHIEAAEFQARNRQTANSTHTPTSVKVDLTNCSLFTRGDSSV
jgi:hypothetical protein